MAALPPHGTVARYKHELRAKNVCDRCRAANTKLKRKQRAKKTRQSAPPRLTLVGPHVEATAETIPPAPEADGYEMNTRPGAWGQTEQAFRSDLSDIPAGTPFFNSLRAAGLVLAREIDDPDGKASKAPLVKQLVDVVRELKGKDSGDGESFEGLLAELAKPPSLASASDRNR